MTTRTLIWISTAILLSFILCGVFVASRMLCVLVNTYEMRVKADLCLYITALEMYKADNAKYPEILEDLLHNELDKLPQDPWKNNYIYLYPSVSLKEGYDLFSLGADRRFGGKKENQDIQAPLRCD